jgi:hypothetical protein
MEGVAIDTQKDKGSRQEWIREFKVTDIGKARASHCNTWEMRLCGGVCNWQVNIQPANWACFHLQMTDSLSPSTPNSCPCPRPPSPFFRHRPLGRAPSPPTWACYEQIPARTDLMGSSDSDSDSGDAADEDSLSDGESSSSDDAETEAAGLMDVESDKDEAAAEADAPERPSDGDPEKPDKGKQRADDPPNTTTTKSVPVSHPRTRRPRGRRPPVSVLRPILTIQRSQGFVWNQVRFLPSTHFAPPGCPSCIPTT